MDRALDKLLYSFSSILLDLCSINYLKHQQISLHVLSLCLHLNQSLPALVLLGLTLACPWESLHGEACLVLLHPWISSQHHVDQNYDHGTVNSDDDTDGYEIKDILMLNL